MCIFVPELIDCYPIDTTTAFSTSATSMTSMPTTETTTTSTGKISSQSPLCIFCFPLVYGKLNNDGLSLF